MRILDKSGSIVGAGFLVDETHVATCAHVVYEAWKGADKNEIRKLSLDVCMDFPFLEPGNIVKATVVKCQNPKTEDDIAVLKLKSSKPQGAAPSILKTSKNMWDHKFRTYGFPKGFNLGLWAEGAIQGPVGTSLVHIEADKVPGTRVKQGFSGAPVWDTKLDAVVGMVAEEDIEAEDKIAFMIPLEILARVWPELDNTAAIASWLPEPWNFESFLNDRRKYFTGREWLFDKINNWLKKTSDSLLLVTGGPGVGKSAIMAELINRDKNNKLLAYYVCQADTPATLEPANFIYSLIGMLSKNVDGYAAKLETPEVKHSLSEEEILKYPINAFEKGVLLPLQELPHNNQHYILIDALDEASVLSKTPNIVNILAAKLGKFPKCLKIIATSRPEISVLQNLEGHQIKIISIEDPKNQNDIELYVDKRLESSPIKEIFQDSLKSKSQLKKALISSSEGNFLVLSTVLEAIEQRRISLDEVKKLPPGLSSLYFQFFRRIYSQTKTNFEPARKVLQVIAAAQEPQTRLQLAAILDIDPQSELPEIMKHLSSFVPLRDERYVLFHRSLFEWLTSWNYELEQPKAGEFHISLKEGHSQWSRFLWKTYLSGNYSEQILCHLPTHLREANQWNNLANVLLDWRFLEAKDRQDTPSYEFISDINTALDSIPVDNPRRHLILLISKILRGLSFRTPLFQSCWNLGWWYDSPETANFYSSSTRSEAPWEGSTEKLCKLMENWRNEKERDYPDFLWMRSLIPPLGMLNSIQRSVIDHSDGCLKQFDVSPDGSRIVSLDTKGELRLWNTLYGDPDHADLLAMFFTTDFIKEELEREPKIELSDPRTVLFSPQDNFIVVGFHSGQLIFLEPNTLEITELIYTNWENVVSLDISPDGSLLAMGSESGWIRLWDLKEDKELCAREVNKENVIEQVVFAAKKNLLASLESRSLDGMGSIKVWKIDTELAEISFEKSYEIPNNRTTSLCFSADGNSLLWSNQEGFIEIHNLVTGKGICISEEMGRPITSFAILPNGDRLLYAIEEESGKSTIILYDLLSRRILRQFSNHSSTILKTKLLRNARSFASADNGTVRVWDLGDNAIPVELKMKEPEVKKVIFDPNRPLVFATAENNNKIWIRSLVDWKIIHILEENEGNIHSMALNKEGTTLAYGVEDGTIRLLMTSNWEEIFPYSLHYDAVEKLAFSPNGKLLASASRDGEVLVFEIDTKRQYRWFSGFVEDRKINIMKFSNNGHLLATSSNSWITVWDIVSNTMISDFFVGEHYDVQFTNDDLTLIVDGNCRYGGRTVWNIDDGKKVDSIEANKTLNSFQLQLGMIWKSPFEMDPGVTYFADCPIALVSASNNSAVAWVSMQKGIIEKHPKELIWSIQNDYCLGIYKLEGAKPNKKQ